MSESSYWNRAVRMSRRSLLGTTALGAGATAFLAACSGSNNSNNGGKVTTNNAAPVAQATFTQAPAGTAAIATAAPQAQSKFIPRTNTTAQAVPGGTFAYYTTYDV